MFSLIKLDNNDISKKDFKRQKDFNEKVRKAKIERPIIAPHFYAQMICDKGTKDNSMGKR